MLPLLSTRIGYQIISRKVGTCRIAATPRLQASSFVEVSFDNCQNNASADPPPSVCLCSAVLFQHLFPVQCFGGFCQDGPNSLSCSQIPLPSHVKLNWVQLLLVSKCMVVGQCVFLSKDESIDEGGLLGLCREACSHQSQGSVP